MMNKMKTIEQRLFEGSRAQEVLENETFIAAFDAIENEVLEQWKNSPARDRAGRESLWTYLMLLMRVKTHLQTTLATGRLAQIDMEHKQSMLDKAKEWAGWNSND
jgi:hypothetical protein